MKRNVAGQFIGAQMITIADGSNFTDPVTVYITGDNGNQIIGSVGLGIAAHKGRGYHSYTPSKAESNFGHDAFTFTGAGAISVTAQAYTNFPQSADVAPIAAIISADMARVLGLVMENLIEDDIIRDSNGNKTSSTIYLYDSAANATTHDKATGLTASYNIAANYTSNLMDLFKSIKAS